MAKTQLYAREGVAFDETVAVRDTNGNAVNLTGFALSLAMFQQAGGSAEFTLTTGVTADAQGLHIVEGGLRIVIDKATLEGVDDDTGDFNLFGDLLGDPAGGTAYSFVTDVRLNCTVPGEDFRGATYQVTLDALAASVIASINEQVDAKLAAAEGFADAAAASAASLTPFKSAPVGNARALEWVIFRTHDTAGSAVTIPANVELREIQIYNTDQLRLRFGEVGGSMFAREQGVGTYLALASTTGKRLVDIVADTDSSGVNLPVIGQAYVDLDLITEAPFSSTNLALALDRTRLFQNPVEVANIDKQIKNLIADDYPNSPWLPTVTDPLLRDLVQDFHVEGGPEGIPYVINREIASAGGGNIRFRLRVYDPVNGIDVCEKGFIATAAALRARTVPTMVLTQGVLAYTGITATAWIDWSKIPDTIHGLSTFTDPAVAGIRPNRVNPRANVMRRFGEKAEPKIRLTVGAATANATHFNSFDAANTSIHDPTITITRSTYPPSQICSFSNQVLVEVVDDNYVEEIEARESTPGIDMGALLSPFQTLRGAKDRKTVLFVDPVTGSAPVLEGPFPFRIERCTIESRGPGYSAHVDNSNAVAKRASAGPAILNYPMVQVFEDCTLKCGLDQLTWNIGCGLSNGHLLRLVRCNIETASNLVGLGAHTSPGTTDPARIELVDCYFNDVLITGQNAVSLLKSHAMTVQHEIVVNNTEMARINVGNSAGGDPGFGVRGKLDSGITVTGTLDR